jgi:hypothetical protein
MRRSVISPPIIAASTQSYANLYPNRTYPVSYLIKDALASRPWIVIIYIETSYKCKFSVFATSEIVNKVKDCDMTENKLKQADHVLLIRSVDGAKKVGIMPTDHAMDDGLRRIK